MYALNYLSITYLLNTFTKRIRIWLRENEQFRLVEDEMLDQHSLPAHSWPTDHQWVKWLRFVCSQIRLQDTLRLFSISSTLLTHDRGGSSHTMSIVIH